MEQVTLDRDEWAAVVRELDTAYGRSAPPGLRSRIGDLLGATPAGWGAEALTLDLDPAAAEVVRAVVLRGRGLPADPGLPRAQGDAVAEAEGVLRDSRASGATARYRIEHRSEGRTVVVARTSAADARQAELSQLAAQLAAAGAEGELVLVDEATGEELARRQLPSVGRRDPDGDT
jgi:hypothetical protein